MANWAYLDGLALSQGMDLTTMRLDRILNFAYWHMHETVQGKTEVEVSAGHERLAATMRWPRDDTSGEGSPSQSAQAAMMGLVPGAPLYIDDAPDQTPTTNAPGPPSEAPPWDSPA